MARSTTTRRDQRHAMSRRALIKWSLATATALGVSRSRLLEILERTAGKGVAFAAAAESTASRLVALACGNGGLSHFQLCWPQVDVARARDPRFAWHRPGEEWMAEGTDMPLAIGPDTPWAALPGDRQVTGFVCGVTETHVRNVQSTSVLNGSNVFAIATAVQASSMVPVPAVTIGDASIGSANNAAIAARVDSVDGFIKLFDSTATHAGGLLAASRDADLFKSQYDVFKQLNRGSNSKTQKPAYAIASGAAGVIGKNRASALQITPADLARYGIDGDTRSNVAELARALIVTAKAFQADLTNAVLMPAMADDPHRHFASGDVDIVPAQLKVVLDAFMADLQGATDPRTEGPLADNVVIAINGDTPKHCLVRDDWPDNTPSNANLMFIYSAGLLKSGWFGSIDRRGNVLGAGPDGKPADYNGAITARYATASLAYAIARGDERRIAEYTNGVSVGDAFGRNRG
jgi:hypothetical protein